LIAMVHRPRPDGLFGTTEHHHDRAKIRSFAGRGAPGGSTTMTPWSCMSSTSRSPNGSVPRFA
jgi:hypothetical protein